MWRWSSYIREKNQSNILRELYFRSGALFVENPVKMDGIGHCRAVCGLMPTLEYVSLLSLSWRDSKRQASRPIRLCSPSPGHSLTVTNYVSRARTFSQCDSLLPVARVTRYPEGCQLAPRACRINPSYQVVSEWGLTKRTLLQLPASYINGNLKKCKINS
ncbi:hypothetical protein RRG08_016106 [Elysia crispata]|uniref:Uncharacterized protein n=1 Tax=Elysia crispata TaxID=231223 RepID=A0AAE1DK21_9GAST|nr:hypothetical protein RRG08_016106 [Elysia crispata]